MDKPLGCGTFLFTVTDPQSSSLVVCAIAAGNYFSVAVLCWHPRFNIVFFSSDGSNVACANINNPIRQIELLKQLFSVPEQFLMKL